MTITTKFNLGQKVHDSGLRRSFVVGEIRLRTATRTDAPIQADHTRPLMIIEYRSVKVSPTGVTVTRGPWVLERYLEAAK